MQKYFYCIAPLKRGHPFNVPTSFVAFGVALLEGDHCTCFYYFHVYTFLWVFFFHLKDFKEIHFLKIEFLSNVLKYMLLCFYFKFWGIREISKKENTANWNNFTVQYCTVQTILRGEFSLIFKSTYHSGKFGTIFPITFIRHIHVYNQIGVYNIHIK